MAVIATVRILRGVAHRSKPLMKLAHIGFMVRLFISLFCSYGDMVTDALMTARYFRTGNAG